MCCHFQRMRSSKFNFGYRTPRTLRRPHILHTPHTGGGAGYVEYLSAVYQQFNGCPVLCVFTRVSSASASMQVYVCARFVSDSKGHTSHTTYIKPVYSIVAQSTEHSRALRTEHKAQCTAHNTAIENVYCRNSTSPNCPPSSISCCISHATCVGHQLVIPRVVCVRP
jgi:hypothetical protein